MDRREEAGERRGAGKDRGECKIKKKMEKTFVSKKKKVNDIKKYLIVSFHLS